MRTRHAIAGLAVGFVALLLYATVRSTSTPLQQSTGDRDAAQEACRSSVLVRAPEARFPFDANVDDRGGGRLHLSGSVDVGAGGQTVRRNYECQLRRDASGAYVADSVVVWQSH